MPRCPCFKGQSGERAWVGEDAGLLPRLQLVPSVLVNVQAPASERLPEQGFPAP